MKYANLFHGIDPSMVAARKANDARLIALANRLGVKPVPLDGLGGRIVLTTAGEERYDIIDLANALLDRIEAATPEQKP